MRARQEVCEGIWRMYLAIPSEAQYVVSRREIRRQPDVIDDGGSGEVATTVALHVDVMRGVCSARPVPRHPITPGLLVTWRIKLAASQTLHVIAAVEACRLAG